MSSESDKKCNYCERNYSSETEVDADLHEGDRIPRIMALEDVRNNTKKLKSDFLGQMESRLSAMIDDVVDNLQKTEFPDRVLMMADPSMMQDKRKAREPGKLPEKEFRSRPSPLTELLEVPHIKTIHHIFVAALILVMMHSICSDIIKHQTVDLGFERLMWTFGQPLTTLGILIPMEFLALFALYPSYYFWSTWRHDYSPARRKMWDYGALSLFTTFMLTFIYIPARAVLRLKYPLPPAMGAIVTMEQCRLLMKMYAFVRSNVPRALIFARSNSSTEPKGTPRSSISEETEDEQKGSLLNGLRKRVHENDDSGVSAPGQDATQKNGIHVGRRKALLKRRESYWISWDWDDEKSPCPSYSRFLYFYFSPTLIYKDKYPRTSSIRWDFVCWNFVQLAGCIFYANMVLGKACVDYFSKFGLKDHPMTVSMLCDAVFSLMMPGIFSLLLGFYLLLHCHHNAFAEALRFGDRLFYKDWWNRESFMDYYKTWNVLVHDFLYTYLFKEAWESGLGQRYKAIPMTLVFLVSSIFHEYILALSLGFFLPVLFLLFGGFGFALMFVGNIRGSLGNIFVWFGLTAGTGIIISSYSMEYFARINCPSTTESPFWDFFIPRSLTCEAFAW